MTLPIEAVSPRRLAARGIVVYIARIPGASTDKLAGAERCYGLPLVTTEPTWLLLR